MKTFLRKPIIAVVLLLALCAPAGNAVTLTAAQLISLGSKAGMELTYHGYDHASSHAYGNGVGVKMEASQYGDEWVKVTNMFNGMVDLHFKVFNEDGQTYLYLDNNAGLSSSQNIYGQIMSSNSSTYAKVCVTPVNKKNTANLTGTQIYGTVSYYDAAKQSFQVDFNIAMNVRYFKSSSATAASTADKRELYNIYTLMFYQPTATITDTQYTDSSASTAREYPAQFNFDSDWETFNVTNWGGTGMGTYATATSYAPGFYNTWYRMEGKYDALKYKMYMYADTEYMFDGSEIHASNNTYYGNPYVYRMWAVNSAANPTSKYTTDIEGDVTFDAGTVSHTGTDLWATPHGGLKTTATASVEFEDWGVYNATRNDYGKTFGFRAANTIATIPDFDVTLALKHQALTLTPGTTSTNLLPVNATASFSVKKNDLYVYSFDVYLVEGSDPKGENTIFLGNVAKNDDNFYSVTASFDLPSVDGRPWSEHVGDPYNSTYTLKVVANYVTYDASLPLGDELIHIKLESSNHGLDSATLNFTVGVGGISTDGGIDVQATHGGVTVTAPEDMAVRIYNAAGSLVAEGRTNSEILLSGNGVYIVKVGAQVRKLIK